MTVLLFTCLAVSAPFTQWATRLTPPAPQPAVADGYRFTGDFFPALAAQAGEKPGAVIVEQIGRSADGRPIWAFHVSDPTVEPTHEALVFAGIHALEWISTEVALDVLEEAIQRPPRGVRLTVVPLLNPDGRARVEKDLVAQRNTYRRANGNNVDINRDFAHNTDVHTVWERIIPGYYGHSETPMSQPETRALDAMVKAHNYERTVSLHAFGGFFYMPWSGKYERLPRGDRLRMVRIGRAMEQAQGSHAYRTRQLGRWGFFFRALGTEVDHMYAEHGADSFLVELTRSGIRPWKLSDTKTYFRWYNPVNPERHRRKGEAAMRVIVHQWSHPLTGSS
jgi:hypothetical protein